MAENGFCPEWIVQNWDRYVDPFFQHVLLTVVSVVIGFAIAAVMAVVAHRRRRLNGPLVGLTEVLYTIPSPAAFLLLLPFTGFGTVSALIALTAYSLNAMLRSMVTGLAGVPEDIKDSARGMGLTERQLLWKVELPLALPEIFAGLRIASVTTVGLATLAFLAGAGGLGESIESQISFKSNVVVAGGLCVLLAVALDSLIRTLQKASTPWTRARLT
ncbi:MAG: ABC transporter permease [Thermoleophilaceae bacterium]|nr:ABC transporter permease [Thermoleophilaceae bacterium]